jgi:hypothetical protein
MKLNITSGIAIAVTIVSVSARATTIPARSVDMQLSPLALCIQKYHPGYPADGSKPSSQEMRTCVDQSFNHKARRSEESENNDVLIYEPEQSDTVKPRAIVDTIQVLGKQLYMAKKPMCDGTNLEKNFVWVEDVQTHVDDVCLQLKDQINHYGLKEDGGLGSIVNTLTNGHMKQGHQLKDKRQLTASYVVNFYPPAKMALDDVKQLATGVSDLCDDALKRIATKGDGCTADIKYFRPSKAKTYHGTGAIGGVVRLFLGADTSPVADISLDFFNDK